MLAISNYNIILSKPNSQYTTTLTNNNLNSFIPQFYRTKLNKHCLLTNSVLKALTSSIEHAVYRTKRIAKKKKCNKSHHPIPSAVPNFNALFIDYWTSPMCPLYFIMTEK